MNCTEVEVLLDEYAAGGLSETVRPELERHVAGCPSCAASQLGAFRLLELLDCAEPELPADFFVRQRAAILGRLGPEIDWQAPRLSLLALAFIVAGYVAGSCGPLMDSVLDIARSAEGAWSTMDGVLPLYGLLMLMAFAAVAHDPETMTQEVRR
jgi:anti-sigma factor RsiW